MRYLQIFEKFSQGFVWQHDDIQYRGTPNDHYSFKDDVGNEYDVSFIFNGTEVELEYYVDDSVTKLTNAGSPFKVANTVLVDILQDFISKNDRVRIIKLYGAGRDRERNLVTV